MTLTASDGVLDWLQATVLGIVEGLTEFLPVSSTGHLIVAQHLLGLPGSEVNHAFSIGIQIGAITAILVLYWHKLLGAIRTMGQPQRGTPNLIWLIGIAAIPAVLVGLLFADWIEEHLFSARVVGITLLVGGLLLLVLERWLKNQPQQNNDLATMSYRTALWIGVWQCLALVPGTSRSGATIGGALVLGMSRTAAAEFSFLVGVPILYGAAFYKLFSIRDQLTNEMLMPMAIGMSVSFLAAIAVVRPFLAFLRSHTFVPFAWYRIVVGATLLALLKAGYLT